MLITTLAMGICMGFQPAISYNCGKGNEKRMYQIIRNTGKASYATIVAFLDKGIVFISTLFLMNHFFGMYGIAFTGCVTLLFSLTAGIFFSLRWNRKLQ